MKSSFLPRRFWITAGCSIALISPLFAQEEGPGGPPPWMQQQQGGGQGGFGGQNQRPPMGGGSTAIAVGEGSVFVISGGQLLKFDEKTLKLQANAPLMSRPGQGQQAPSSRQGPEGQPGGPQGGPEGDQGGPGSQQGGGQGGFGGQNQRPPTGGMGGPGGGGAALTVNDGFVYVVSGGKLSKFDATTLELISSVEIQKKTPPPSSNSGRKKPIKSTEVLEKPGE